MQCKPLQIMSDKDPRGTMPSSDGEACSGAIHIAKVPTAHIFYDLLPATRKNNLALSHTHFSRLLRFATWWKQAPCMTLKTDFPFINSYFPYLCFKSLFLSACFFSRRRRFVTPAIPIVMMANAVLLISTQPGYSSCFRTTPCNKHPDPKH